MTPHQSVRLTPERWKHIESTLERVLELPSQQRSAFLERACADDADLRREVESLMASDPTTGFLERPVLSEFAPAQGSADMPPNDALRGDGRHAIAPIVGAIPTEMARRLSVALQERYTIERELGRGGMATVFLARDLRHRRSVAIKVLYPELSAVLGSDRFVQEIELTASLQHPHILPLYESGSADGLLFYVMPSVDGETLRARLTRERHLPIADVVRIAREVADALSYAHTRGIVHRDVKPENILLQGEHALVADFGIALAVEHAGGERMTRTGYSPGTPQYMAPEQAMGDRVVDARADVYALGVVTYEMLAGEPPFHGPSVQSVLSRVLTESAAELRTRRPTTPAHVAAAVHWAMERIPADRIPSASAFAAALVDPALTHERRTDSKASTPPARPAFRLSPRTVFMMASAALVAFAGAAGYGWMRSRSVAAAPAAPSAQVTPVRFAIDVDSLVRRVESPALSPDGRTVVYVGSAGDRQLLMVRRLDDIAAHPLKGADDGSRPFFSPDGRSVGFVRKNALWRVKLEGGKPELVTQFSSGDRFAGASWGSDGAIVYAIAGRGLFRVAPGGLAAAPIWSQSSGDQLVDPQILPEGQSLLVTVNRSQSAKVGILNLSNGSISIVSNGFGARYAKGYLIFTRGEGTLFRLPFDLASSQATGSQERIEQSLDALGGDTSDEGALFDVAPNGTIVFRSVTPAPDGDLTRLYLTDRTGRELSAFPAERPWSPRFSPDGSRVAYGAYSPGRKSSDIYISDVRTGSTTRLTNNELDSNDPRWSPDGKSIAFSANTETGKDLFVQSISGGEARALTHNDGSEWPTAWTPNGAGILFTQLSDNNQRDIWLQPVNGGAARAIIATGAQETSGSLSPDGKWILFQSDESGREEIYVDSYPVRGHRTRVSNGNAVNPMWRGDGHEIFYWQDGDFYSARVGETRPNQTLAVYSPVRLFRATYTPTEMAMYDVSRDGTHFVLVANAPRAGRLVVETGMLSGGR